MRAIAANFGARQYDLKSEMLFDLAAQFGERLTEKFFNFAASQADDVSVFLLQSSLVIMLVAALMHQVEFVDESALFKHLQGAVDGDAIELGILLFGESEKGVGVEMLAGFVDQFEKDFALPRQPDALLPERVFDAGRGHSAMSVTCWITSPIITAKSRLKKIGDTGSV